MHFSIPLRTGRGLNDRHDHWRQRHERVVIERDAVRLGWPWRWRERTRRGEWRWPVEVLLVRIAPSRGLDDDNLRGALKGVRDQVADELGLKSDRDPQHVRWRYAQERGPWGVRVELSERKESA